MLAWGGVSVVLEFVKRPFTHKAVPDPMSPLEMAMMHAATRPAREVGIRRLTTAGGFHESEGS